jgi:hypothetical protein
MALKDAEKDSLQNMVAMNGIDKVLFALADILGDQNKGEMAQYAEGLRKTLMAAHAVNSFPHSTVEIQLVVK